MIPNTFYMFYKELGEVLEGSNHKERVRRWKANYSDLVSA